MKKYVNNLKTIIDDTFEKNKTSDIFNLIIESLKKGNKVLLCGNGGSASQAAHLHTELIVKYNKADRKSLPSICLSNSGDLVTAHTNDFDFETVFSRQVSSLGRENDLLIAFTTSGKSPNVIKACEMAKSKKMKVIGITGKNNNLDLITDKVFKASSLKTSHIQEMHLLFLHLLCEELEKEF